MPNLTRYLRHVPSATTGSTAPFDENQGFGAGRHQLLLASNARYLLQRNAVRPLATHPGVKDFWRGSLRGISSTFTGTPGPDEVQWQRRASDGSLAIHLGTHVVKPYPGDTRLPQLVVRYRIALDDAGDTAGVVLLAEPGGYPNGRSHSTGTTHTGTSWSAGSLSLSLEDRDVRRVRLLPVGGTSADAPAEEGDVLLVSVWLGGYCSSNQDAPGRRASIAGITLGLEPPA